MFTSSNLSLPFRFHDPNFICTFYHLILATWSVHLAPTPVLDQSSPFIQQCRLRSQVQTLHDLHRLTTARTYDYHPNGKPRDRWMQCACVWSICLDILYVLPTSNKVDLGQRCKPARVSSLFEAEAEHNNNSHCFGVGPYVGEQTIKETKQKVSETGFASILR
jgi:hypothetical protein